MGELCVLLDNHFNVANAQVGVGTNVYPENGLPAHEYSSLETSSVGQWERSETLSYISNQYLTTAEPQFEKNEAHENARFYVRVIVMPVVSLFGICGNILNIIVLTRRRMQASMDCTMEKAAYIGLIALAVSDMLYCITSLPEAFKGTDQVIFDQKSFWMVYEMYGKYVQNTFAYSSTWLTLLMAGSRYVAICHPFVAREFVKASTTIIGIVVTFVFWLLLDLPHIWTYNVSEISCPSTNGGEGNVYYMLDTGSLGNPTLKTTFTYIWTFLGFFIPVALLAYCNFHLIQALRESYRVRKESRVHGRTQQTGNKITPTLIAIVAMYLFLVTPSEVIQFAYFLVKGRSQTDTLLTLMVIFNVMHALNFSINFVLYCVVNVHFRSTLKDLLFCFRPRRGQHQLLQRQFQMYYTNATSKTYAPYNQTVADSMV